MVRPLAPYASKPEETRGRLHPEPEHSMRSVFQRDRDRIIHSAAFRRLTHKTQVFVYHEGDHYRTRLTHSLEVAQIARTVSRALGLDEDLAETLALAHDLGHTPFGHAGEEALNAEMVRFGGFSHNDQTLRILTRLEKAWEAFEEINRAGLLHRVPADWLRYEQQLQRAERFFRGGDLVLADELLDRLQVASEVQPHPCAALEKHLGRRTAWNKADWLPVLAPSPVRDAA